MILIISLVLIRIFSNSFSGVFQKKLSKNFYASYINTICYFILTLFCLLGAKFFDFSNFEVFKFALFSGLIGAIGNIFQIKALNLGELSILAPINSYKIIFRIKSGELSYLNDLDLSCPLDDKLQQILDSLH